MKTILHLVPKMHFGGTESVVINLIESIGCHRHIVVTHRSKRCARVIASGGEIQIVEDDLEELRRKVEERKPNLVIHHWYSDGSNSMDHYSNLKTPKVVVIHTIDVPLPSYVHGHEYVAVSKLCKMTNTHLSKVRLIPNAIRNLSTSLPARIRRNEVNLVKVARAFPERFSEKLFQMLGNLLDLPWQLTLVLGDGPLIPKIKYWISKYQLCNRTNIIVDIEDVSAVLSDMDIYLDYNACFCKEAWGIAISEALAHGLLVIGHQRGAINEQITHNINGILVNSDLEFSFFLRKFIQNYDDSMKIRTRAAELANCSSKIDKFKKGYNGLIEEIIG